MMGNSLLVGVRVWGGEMATGIIARWEDKDGYIRIKRDHPTRPVIFGHVAVMEGLLGRPLKRSEAEHHINFIRSDNRPGNLVLMKRADHQRFHCSLTARNMGRGRDGRFVAMTAEQRHAAKCKRELNAQGY